MDVYEIVTEKIVAELESGTVPWRKPWGTEPPANLRSGKPYRGVNVFLLATAPFGSPHWVTFRQARDLGGAVRAGEKRHPVVFWTWYEKHSEKTPAGPDSDAKDRRIPVLRYYTVFNVEQCDGLTIPETASQRIPFAPIERAESIVAGMPEPPRIERGHAAFYVPSADTVIVPRPDRFAPPRNTTRRCFTSSAMRRDIPAASTDRASLAATDTGPTSTAARSSSPR